ncbi:hypothetical protein AEB_P1439 [Altererythrobacter sp. B11]|uniref:hypothetical protein n=1 Tax=Altererythrobacter sp. B11 TaxID=2060312 RepID=UPI000DC6D942|nr:hypothetical protein [Altererythrobacter sp. B11]BBC72307.1 hypothetical protein AEB_P1439 [Altererythrobacter sp. B11]
MLHLGLAAALVAAAAASGGAVIHERVLDSGGTAYRLTYSPDIRVERKTIGTSAGPRPSTMKCLWRAEVRLQRSITDPRSGREMSTLLPETRRFSGTMPGNCRLSRNRIEPAEVAERSEVRSYLAQAAAEDEDRARAFLATARSL